MNDQGHLTAWTGLLIVAGIVLAVTGGALAPDGSVCTWLLIGAWGLTLTALNNVFRKVRAKADEHQIRADERARLAGLPPQDRSSQHD